MEELLAPRGDMIGADRTEDEPAEQGSGQSASDAMSDMYRPVTNWEYRGAMSPEFITTQLGPTESDGKQAPDGDRLPGQGSGRDGRKPDDGGHLAGGRCRLWSTNCSRLR